MPNHGAVATATTTITMFMTTGESAGAANSRSELSTPVAAATRPMKKMYGNTTRVSVTVSSSLPGTAAKPGANRVVIGAAKSTPSTVMPASTSAMTVNSTRAT